MKKWILIALLIVCLAPVAQAAKDPQKLIQDVAADTIDRLKKDKALFDKDPGQLYAMIDELLLPHFDFERMSKWVLGKYWRRATASERKRFIEEFRTLLVRTYASSLSDFRDQKINYMPFHGDLASGDVTVKSEVDQPGGFPIPINYRLHLVGGHWKAYDVTIDDISLVANYRTSFSKEIRVKGVSGLIDQLAKKNNEAKK